MGFMSLILLVQGSNLGGGRLEKKRCIFNEMKCFGKLVKGWRFLDYLIRK